MEKKLTPLMRQYWDVKSQHEDKIVFFRMGDFFEMFHQDAETAAPILNIALTVRNKKSGDDTKMCGMPHHSIAGAIAKLLGAGYKVAICDQVEDPKLAKGLVKRAVTRILSPGMVYDPETLDELQANYLCSFDKDSAAFFDSSTGEAFYYQLSDSVRVSMLLAILKPVEIILDAQLKTQMFAKLGPDYHITAHSTDASLQKNNDDPSAVLRLKSYVKYMQAGEEKKISFEKRSLNQHLSLQSSTYKHLEVFKTYAGEDKGSLFFAINRCKTSSGSRLLKKWLSFPLVNPDTIAQRQDEIEFWLSEVSELKVLRKTFAQVGDVQRRLNKLAQGHSGPRDLLSVCQSIKSGLAALNVVKRTSVYDQQQRLMVHLIDVCEEMLVEDPPVNTQKGGFIQKGFDSDLDELIEVADHGQKLLAELEAKERAATGINNLKVKYNNVFGYFIEVTHAHKDKVPEHYIRKQTLTNAERYLTTELKDLEEKILSGKSKRIEFENKLFTECKNEFLKLESEILLLSQIWSELDILSGFAWLAMEQNYTRPSFNTSKEVQLKASRHPVVEQQAGHVFVANDIYMGAGQCLLLTGPNMAGKSTIMRQVAVIAIMAQVGCFVPAKKASLPLYQQIFTRIGASDSLSEGLSTFMVEMKETSEIIQKACEDSLIIMDEVGRGTSTYDGMSLAQALLEYILSKKQATPHCLFATHYHELTALTKNYKNLQNIHMSISEENGQLNFLYKLANGAANKSYGIQVAKLAGLPASIVKRADSILKGFETGAGLQPQVSDDLPLFEFNSEPEMDESQEALKSLKDEILKMSLSEVTPLQALNTLSKWQQDLS